MAWIVPIRKKGRIAGYALFGCDSAGDDVPELLGVFDSLEEAKSALTKEGAVAGAG
jgi:hypothetical protein